jgi:aspartate carbamoyltransferase catalytic subunit
MTKHLLSIDPLSASDIEYLIQLALDFKTIGNTIRYPHHQMGILFYENSTRTRISFELAAHHLGIKTIAVNTQTSSIQKGEGLYDTLLNLHAMGINTFVIRQTEEGLLHHLVDTYSPPFHLINAGDGTHAHPSQALLDVMTIYEQHPDMTGLKITVIGNISHSRVARSLGCIFERLGVSNVVWVAPKIWQPDTMPIGFITDNIEEGLVNADIVITLRIQQERLNEDTTLPLEQYIDQFQLNESRLALAKQNVMLMHPGPVNQNIELTTGCYFSDKSAILRQVKNGVFMRMAILDTILKSSS